MALSASPVVGQRTAAITPVGVERMGDAADVLHDRTLLRPANLDTDLRPPAAALEVTEAQLRDDEANSYLPFFGHERPRRAAVRLVERDGAPRHNRLQFDGMAHSRVTVGAASQEYRMIGWRVGWVVGPLAACEAIGRVAISNVVCPVGIAQQAVAAAIESPDDGIAASVA